LKSMRCMTGQADSLRLFCRNRLPLYLL